MAKALRMNFYLCNSQIRSLMNLYKQNSIKLFYHPHMVPEELGRGTETPSPMKPKRLMEFLARNEFLHFFELVDDFPPFMNDVFYLGHDPDYVEGFFEGKAPYANSYGLLGIDWSESFAQSVRYTNASLYHAIDYAITHPDVICLSPTSGFHHAIPKHGGLFCAFSGQVIAAKKIYQETGKKGAFIDLDGHFGNSIEDSRGIIEGLDEIIPRGANVNIKTVHREYLEDFKIRLWVLKELILEGKVDYLVFCHGADSHEHDDIGRQLTTEEWMACSTIFCEWLIGIQSKLQKEIPLALSLFGGYRKDDFESVLSLHTASILNVLKLLGDVEEIDYQPKVVPASR